LRAGLFTPRHARRILAAYAPAQGAEADRDDVAPAERETFLDRAVEWLAVGDKVVAAQLSLFVDWLRGKPWNADTLKALGRTPLGVALLDETFTASTASAGQRRHEAAARRLLADLLPDAAGAFKGPPRTRSALLEASGYADSPPDFEALLLILGDATHLISPAVDNGLTPGREASYQLTHDLLVPAVREWLDRDPFAVRRGRIASWLAARTARWQQTRLGASPNAPFWKRRDCRRY
jgi:hypothetical protein